MPNDLITLSSAPHPFEAATKTVPVVAGGSLQNMLEQAQPDPVLMQHAVIFIDGQVIERKFWRCVYPKAGTLVEIRVLPTGGGGGGGKDTLRTVLQLAVLVASIAIPGLAAFSALSTTQSALFTAGIALVGNLAINALVPIEQPKRREEEDVFGISGLQNRARPFEAVPQILGRHRVAPDYGARVFTEIVGKDQYLRAIFVWGVGPLHIDESSLRIGETPISNFNDVEMEHRAGLPGDAPLTLYSDSVFQDDLQILLGETTDEDMTTGAQTRVAPADADELSLDVTFPGGLINIGRNSGDRISRSIEVRIQYRKVGDSTWLTPSFTAKTFPDDWINGDVVTFTGKRQAPIRHGMRWSVPENGQYEVRLERLPAPVGQGRKTDATYWTALRAIKDDDPISSRAPVAKTAIRIKATDQLNGVLDQFNGIVTTLGKDWDGTSWVDNQQITNPASLFRHVLQGRSNAIPLPDDRVNLSNLEDFHDFNVAKGFECNTVVTTGRSMWEVLAEVAACGRASPAEIDGKWGVVIDRPQSIPVSHITPRNSADFVSEKAFIELPHAFRIPFINEEENWRRDERRVYRSGFDQTNATEFEELRLPGITNPDQVERMGRYRMAQGIQQPERFTFKQDMEFLTYQRGDRVKITHDVLLLGLASGRVKDVVLGTSNSVTGLILDEEVEIEAGKSYGITIRTLANPSLNVQVASVVGVTNEVTFDFPVPSVDGAPAIARNDIFGFGLFGQETDDAQIIAIAPTSNAEARIAAVPYRESIYAGDGEPIPPFETNLTPLETTPPAPIVRDVVSDENVITLDGAGNLRFRVAFNVDPLPTSARFSGSRLDIQQRANGIDEPWVAATIDERNNGIVVAGGFTEGEVLDFRLRWVPPNDGLPGPWVEVIGHTVAGRTQGMSGPVISVGSFTVRDGANRARRPALKLSWSNEAPLGSDTLAYEVRVWLTSALVAKGTVDAVAGSVEIHDVLPDTVYEVRARFVMGDLIVWSSWESRATPNIKLSDLDIADGGIKYANFASDVTQLFTDIEDQFDDIVADIGTLQSDTVALESDVTTLQSNFTTLNGTVSGNVTAISGLETRVTDAEGDITFQSSQITALQGDITTLDGTVSGNVSAIDGLDTRLTSNENTTTAQATSITNLESSVTGLETDTSGNASAISTLDTRVTNAEGDITAISSDITVLNTTVGNNTTTITQVAQSVDGIEGRYGVTIDNNGNISGIQLLSGAGGSAFNVRADQFAVFSADGTEGSSPFFVLTSPTVIDGVTVPAGTYIDKARIGEAWIGTLNVERAAINQFSLASQNTFVDVTTEPEFDYQEIFAPVLTKEADPSVIYVEVDVVIGYKVNTASTGDSIGYRLRVTVETGSGSTTRTYPADIIFQSSADKHIHLIAPLSPLTGYTGNVTIKIECYRGGKVGTAGQVLQTKGVFVKMHEMKDITL